MLKAATLRKVTAIRSAPVDTTVKFKTINRGRNKTGHATISNVKTTLEFLPSDPEPAPAPEPTPPPPVLSDTLPGDSELDGEDVIQLTTPKGRSKAVLVSFHVSRGVDSG
jgi:hypothetical protein